MTLDDLAPTPVFDAYWRFAAERLWMLYRRLRGEPAPWTEDRIIADHRFCNTYRATDRVTQYLLREVQYAGSQDPAEVVYRTLLFKTFNKIETWEYLEFDGGPPQETLDRLFAAGIPIYSQAYIMPSPPFGGVRKHENHLALIDKIMSEQPWRSCATMEELYAFFVGQPGIGRFLAYQYALDLAYSSAFEIEESAFVIAGPGAVDGVSKCFANPQGSTPEQIIALCYEEQEQWFARLGIDFPGLFGRRLPVNDCQGLFCEISKYSRVSHPEVVGAAGRTRIKQRYRPLDRPLPPLFFPPRWGLDSSRIPEESGL